MKLFLVLGCCVAMQLNGLIYEKQFENEKVRVSKLTIEPQEEIGAHCRMYPGVVVALKGGTLTRIVDGEGNDVDFPTGVAVYREADTVLHSALNNSSETIELIVIDLLQGN